MISTNVIWLAALLVGVNCRFIVIEDPPEGLEEALLQYGGDDLVLESVHPGYLAHSRERRQAQTQTQTSLNTEGGLNSMIKVPLAHNDKNYLSGIGSAGYNLKQSELSSIGGGLALDNVNGHGASLTGRHIPGFGDQVTGAGHLNLLHNENHRIDANAFASRTMPKADHFPGFNTYGGGVDYMFKDKVGASLSASHTPMFDKTDYSAMGNLNLFKGRDSSLDLNAGFSKSISPHFTDHSWKPSGGFTWSKSW